MYARRIAFNIAKMPELLRKPAKARPDGGAERGVFH